MQPVVGDGNEGIGCPAQELYPLTLQHCEGHLPQGKETFSLEVKSPFHPPPTPDLWDPLWRSWVREDRRILSTETVPGNSCREKLPFLPWGQWLHNADRQTPLPPETK